MRRRLSPLLLAASGLAAFGFTGHWPAATGTTGMPPSALRAVSVTAFNPQGAALTQTIHDDAGLHLLQRDLQHLTPRLRSGIPFCPADNGSHYRAVFSYANRPALVADIHRTGCEVVSLGGRWAPTVTWSNPQLVRDLDRLFPAEWQTGF